MYEFLKLIVMMSFPVRHICISVIRKFSQNEHPFGVPYLKEILFKLTDQVETEIKNELAKTRGAIVHDD